MAHAVVTRLDLAVRNDERRETRVGEEHGDRRVGIGRWGGQHRLLQISDPRQTEHLFDRGR
jgi:hypothetical protein